MIVVARMRMRSTVPLMSPMVTVSPTLKGRSNSTTKPQIKFATISCNPKPMPTLKAATSHCKLPHLKPIVLKAIMMPIAVIAYRLTLE
jgi:hypothetical protein